MAERCPECGQARPEPTEAHVVDGVLVEPVSLQVVGAPPFWRAAGRPDLPLATFPAQAAQLAKLSPVKAATARPDLLANLEETAR